MNWKQRQHTFRLSDRDRPGPTGLVFDIQRFAVHDGGGIRTLVFLKGCPLRCQWCQNPESMFPGPEILRIPHNCISCVKCMTLCPQQAICYDGGGEIDIDRVRCDLCGDCVTSCYAGSMTIVGRYLTAGEVMEEVDRDRKFYAESGGGVTFSGGEPTSQPDFLLSCLRAAKARGLHTAVETCGHAPWETLAALRDVVDLFLCDIKHMDTARHRELTGMPNERILDNIAHLSQAGSALRLRLPLVPGVNDSEANIVASAQFAAGLPTLEGFDILPYHRLGEAKWRQLGRVYPLHDVAPHTREDVLAKACLAGRHVEGVGIGG
ncbi:glycyl-radical enzyme activating protein [Solidesulfovibrio carbinolicus]|uniref:Glycyl-radical enzyme activating protein n=1 Tax=Solidesulfovibrio carbinolicus TaxID=296842 RepID=A0A4P6HI66_9BACT|nr:glycyl-radical enzyme activating protein [Solidesulfovibrio carbinolicus]QAZ66737.1 glycyl-radical enzyme activating protein [Solidesulfovibrio carbinolicus]